MKKTVFNVLQGCAVVNHNGYYDLTLIESFDNLEAGEREFNYLKHDYQGWIYPVLITQLEKVEYEYNEEDEEWVEVSNDIIEYEEYNHNDDVEDDEEEEEEEEEEDEE